MAWLYPRIQSREPLTVDEIYDNLGMDEVMGVAIVGKTAIAGPVCAGSVILPIKDTIKFLQPAKALSKEELRQLASYIKSRARHITVGWGSVAEIHTHGIDAAVRTAVSSSLRLVSAYDTKDFIIMDDYTFLNRPANLLSPDVHLLTIDKAHEFVEPVIAAQIVTILARDAMMASMHREFPEYDWENNNGYATPMHLEAIRMHGYSSYHRPLNTLKSLKGERLFMHQNLKRMVEDKECTQ
jgi:ribonuclease HII